MDRLFNTECHDCERTKSPDATFINERYWQRLLVGAFGHTAEGQR